MRATSAPSSPSPASLRSLLGYAQQTGYLPFNVGAAVRPRRVPDRLAERILPERDCLNLLAAAGHTVQGARNTALLGFLYYTGCRVSEACGLQWRDLHLADPPTVALHGKGGRTRHVGLPPACGEALQRLRPGDREPDDPVFTTRTGRALSRHEVGAVVKAAARRAGIDAPVSPHWLRHAHATYALDRGARVHLVQATLGHASLVTTSRYVHVRPGESSGHALAGAGGRPAAIRTAGGRVLTPPRGAPGWVGRSPPGQGLSCCPGLGRLWPRRNRVARRSVEMEERQP